MRTSLLAIWLGVRVSAADDPLFIAFGDFGEDRHEYRSTVAQLKLQPRPRFVALLGDLFYPKGVTSVHDPQFELFQRFADISDRFLIAAGNHDYCSGMSALLAYPAIDHRWVFPSTYYSERMSLGSGIDLCAIILDTHVFEPKQLDWLSATLAACQGPSTYRIIFAHHPLLTVGIYGHDSQVARLRSKLMPLMDRFGVHAYISGHEHQMQAFEVQSTHFLISGATAQLNRNKEGDKSLWRTEQRFVNDKEAGFISFTFSKDRGLHYSFIRSDDGEVLYAKAIPQIATTRRPSITTTAVPTVTTAKVAVTAMSTDPSTAGVMTASSVSQDTSTPVTAFSGISLFTPQMADPSGASEHVGVNNFIMLLIIISAVALETAD